ncbi:MAG TPA: rhodanese-like domain-containing protein [Candidatus Dormibacteraeota bacterium]|jgi:rhodanese-related sulfurtransferase
MRAQAVFMGEALEYDEVSLDEAEQMHNRDAVPIVDVRNAEERTQKRIPGSIAIPLNELEQRRGEVPPGLVMMVCAKGARSAKAAQIMEAVAGRTDVSSIAGGTDGWEAAGKPIDRG